jgi:hypothetical protein
LDRANEVFQKYLSYHMAISGYLTPFLKDGLISKAEFEVAKKLLWKHYEMDEIEEEFFRFKYSNKNAEILRSEISSARANLSVCNWREGAPQARFCLAPRTVSIGTPRRTSISTRPITPTTLSMRTISETPWRSIRRKFHYWNAGEEMNFFIAAARPKVL